MLRGAEEPLARNPEMVSQTRITSSLGSRTPPTLPASSTAPTVSPTAARLRPDTHAADTYIPRLPEQLSPARLAAEESDSLRPVLREPQARFHETPSAQRSRSMWRNCQEFRMASLTPTLKRKWQNGFSALTAVQIRWREQPLPRRTSSGEQLTRTPAPGWVSARSIGRLRLFGLRFTRCDCHVRQVACRSTSLRRPVCIEWRQVIE